MIYLCYTEQIVLKTVILNPILRFFYMLWLVYI